MSNINTIIISDLHLGDPRCSRKNIIKIINLDFKKLIVNGDVFSCYHKNKLTCQDYFILEVLEYLQSKDRCVVLKGNHEMYIKTSKYTSLNFISEYNWDFFGYKMHAEHGHKISPLLKPFSSLSDRSLRLAEKRGYDCIFVGHSHFRFKRATKDKLYVNTGSFITYENNYLCLYDNVTWELKSIVPPVVNFLRESQKIIDAEIVEMNEYFDYDDLCWRKK